MASEVILVKDIRDAIKELDSKVDEHTKILSSIDKTLALQAQQLETHIRRTEVAEENLDMLRKDFKPVENHVEFVNKLSKLVALSAAVVSAGFAGFEFFKWIMSVL
jgi:cell division septum initiation protein DivIVA